MQTLNSVIKFAETLWKAGVPWYGILAIVGLIFLILIPSILIIYVVYKVRVLPSGKDSEDGLKVIQELPAKLTDMKDRGELTDTHIKTLSGHLMRLQGFLDGLSRKGNL